MGHCHKCNRKGHQTHECRTKIMHTQIFEGYFYNCHKYGQRAFECRSKPMWSLNRKTKVRNNGNSYNWHYNTRYSFHYFQQYGHVPKNCIRTQFKGNYQRWLSQTTCFSCHKNGHIRKNCPTRSKAPKSKFDKGKTEVEHIRNEMNRTWKKKDTESTSNGEGITSPNGSSGHISSN